MPQISTTHPSASTNQKAAARRPRQVRWVFPEGRLMPLAAQHVVGRDETCGTVLLGKEISRQHAEFRLDGPIAAVRDLASRNGLFVNGLRCQDARLDLGDVVRCGEWIGVVVDEEPPVAFSEISADWYGGAVLRRAVEPARRLTGDLRVVVQGATGTGKEGMARALHRWSGRAGEFIAVNCAALPESLAEAELFGYRKGAFTGADRSTPGLFRAAEKGTLFLDEILELSPVVQAKLLRVLELKAVRALGETHDVPIDVRVICATQMPLSDAVAAGQFRADLCARLDNVTVTLPPLRTRREDIAPLFLRFVHDATGGRPPVLEAKLVESLCLYQWPANVRELLAVTHQLLAMHGEDGELKKVHLPPKVLEGAAAVDAPAAAAQSATPPLNQKRQWRKTDDDEEFTRLVEALRVHEGSVAKAAASMGIGRARAYRLLSAHPEFSAESMRR